MRINRELPLFLHDNKTKEIFKIVVASTPKGTKAYLVGGAIRNAIYFQYFKKELPSRDFDIMLIGDKDGFVKNLRNNGFVYGKIKRKHQVVVKMKRIPKPVNIYNDYFILDIHNTEERNVLKNLAQNSNFTINGSIISLKDIFRGDWFSKLISLPGALDDLKNKQLKLNQLSHPSNIFSCMRFMSLGFKQPTQTEIDSLLKNLGGIERSSYERNLKKLFSYVGGEEKARELLKKLKIEQDILDLKVIKAL